MLMVVGIISISSVLDINNGFIVIFNYTHIQLNKQTWITYPISLKQYFGSGYTINGSATCNFVTVQKGQIGFRFDGTDNGNYSMGYIVCGF